MLPLNNIGYKIRFLTQFIPNSKQYNQMKKILVIVVLIVVGQHYTHAQTTQWGFDGSHAKVGFSIAHFGISETEGKFTKFEGTVLSDKSDFSDAKISFVIDVNSINTEDTKRDEHLKSADFF
jgi:polyisoprenoid-binding protein YceI